MKIGIDASVFRETPTGIYNYVWNLARSFGNLTHEHDISLVLYGPRVAEDKELLGKLKRTFSRTRVVYAWDGWPLKLFSDRNLLLGVNDGSIAQKLDGAIVYYWKKLHQNYPRFARASGSALFRSRQCKNYDVFHHTFGLTFPLQRKANVLTIYDLIPRLFPEQYSGALDWFRESFECAREMDLILTISENTKRDVIELLDIPEERIRVSPLAAHEQYRPIEDKEQIASTLTRYGIADRPYVLSLGTLEYRRNMHRLVEAFHHLKQEREVFDHQLVLVGTEGESSQIIFETIHRLGLNHDVKCLGHVNFNDLPYLFNGAELFVYPSLYEGFGLPPLEAMACGTPVVASNASSLPEVIGDGGLLFNPTDVVDMASIIHRVLKSDKIKKDLRERALARARQFTWRRTAEITMQAYEEARAHSLNDQRWKRARRMKRTVIQRNFVADFFKNLDLKYLRYSEAK